MTDLPASVGVLTVTGQLLSLIADSTDPDERPDARVPLAAIRITASAPTPVVALAEKTMLTFDPVDAYLDIDGRIVPAADGESGLPGIETEIRLVAPIQTALSHVAWGWLFHISPIAPSTHAPFTVFVTGVPGAEVDLGDSVIAGLVSSSVAQPKVWEQVGTDLPDDIKVGDFLIDTTVPTAMQFYVYR